MMKISCKGISFLREVHRAVSESYLLKVLQSEIRHELSSPRSQDVKHHGSMGEFSMEWDRPDFQDVVLRRRCASGEEVVVSALLGSYHANADFSISRHVDMKVCIKKQFSSPILLFDCKVYPEDDRDSSLHIECASYLRSSCPPKSSSYPGPEFWTLDQKLQIALRDFLESRGINDDLTKFLLFHFNKKEQAQYVKWLQKLESFVSVVP